MILVTNDDGVNSRGIRLLAGELKGVSPVMVVAPSQEQSAIGTAVSLRQPVRVNKVEPVVPGVETWAVDGTPSDSVILALGKLAEGVDLVVSGINQGPNLGEDVYISGTVGAALQAYLRGFPAMAVSAASREGRNMEAAAKVAAIVAGMVVCDPSLSDIFLNVNIPDLPLRSLTGAKLTRLACESHVNSVETGEESCYRLVRQSLAATTDNGNDVWAVQNGNISITPLYTRRFNKGVLPVLELLCSELYLELRRDGHR